MVELGALVIVFGLLGVACLIGWSAGVLLDTYWKYRVKRNRVNHPKLVELVNERDKILNERSCWWRQKNKAEKEIQECEDKIRYGGSTPELCEKLTKCHADWREAFENLERTEPLLIEAREAVDNYREAHNIRHW